MDDAQRKAIEALIAANRVRRAARGAVRVTVHVVPARSSEPVPAASAPDTRREQARGRLIRGMKQVQVFRMLDAVKAGEVSPDPIRGVLQAVRPVRGAGQALRHKARSAMVTFLAALGLAVLVLCVVLFARHDFAPVTSRVARPAIATLVQPIVRFRAHRPMVWTAPTHVPTGPLLETLSGAPVPGVAESSSVTPPAPSGAAGHGQSVPTAIRLPKAPVSAPAPENIAARVVAPPRIASVLQTPASMRPYREKVVPTLSARAGVQHLATVVVAPRAVVAPAVPVVTPRRTPIRVLPVPVQVAAPRIATIGLSSMREKMAPPALPAPATPDFHVRQAVAAAPSVHIQHVQHVRIASTPAAPAAPVSSFVIYRHVAAGSPSAGASPFGSAVRLADATPVVTPGPRPIVPAAVAQVAQVAPAARAVALSVIAFPSPSLVLIGSRHDGQMQVSPYQVGQKLPDGSKIMHLDAADGLVFTDRGTLRLATGSGAGGS